MTEARRNRLLRPETLTAIGLIVAATGFLIPTFDLRPISALLPAAMLIGLIVLSALLLVSDQRKAAAGEVAKPVSTAPGRVIGAFALIVGYAVATDLLGFYPSTIVIIPLVSAIFGYRSPLGLVIATAIVVGSIWLIFDFGMSQDFPAGRLWQD
ncbi:tripartite tricarboxylate transporter TctB family protein [Pseudooceanicola nanhaiensis]|uniref:tripartite tricarboxylate transporter TctB family protein n=1 Tax=Pseudooceanicola nanhaiensis TaxID=375761 RepID=UPI001CD5C7AB|nr:tripartite tricarboxylate transporter TctB family protein [Pseudooceanicola nanhaiensis]MCA0919258.1 tripartite tricarboxylate transporter TctB family protein [Pseudooceanicola nanhaiensis]